MKSAAGVNVTFPEASTLHVPSAVVAVVWFPGVAGSKSTVLASMVPSTSVSLPVTLNVIGVSSGVVALSSFAIGASFTGVTVTKIVSFTQIAGNGVPSSQISTTTISLPL